MRRLRKSEQLFLPGIGKTFFESPVNSGLVPSQEKAITLFFQTPC